VILTDKVSGVEEPGSREMTMAETSLISVICPFAIRLFQNRPFLLSLFQNWLKR
jgi:hypothetical protein